MGRSLLGRLDLTNSVSDRFAEAQSDLASKYIRFDLVTLNRPKAAPLNIRVAVVGGGFAGLAAASVLQNLHVPVTVYEAHDHLGGRVEMTRSLFRSSPERILERGTELIGSSTSHRLDSAREGFRA